MADLAESLVERFSLVRPHLTELQQRLWLGAEASVLGSGGVAVVAAAVGAATDTVRPRIRCGGAGPRCGRRTVFLPWAGHGSRVVVASAPRRTTTIWWRRWSR